MKGKWTLLGSILAVLLLALAVGLARAQGPQPPTESVQPQGGAGIQATALGTAFTYQGQLKKAGSPISDTCDFQFSLWDASTGGTQIGSTQTKTGVSVSNGYFTIPNLDFGAGAFQGDARWLQIGVKCAGDSDYVPLSPRQALTAAPYALGLRPGAQVVGSVTASPFAVVYARNAATSGTTYDVRGESDSTSGTGVYGLATATSGWTYGVWGQSDSTNGYGVFGYASATSGWTYGVFGKSESTDGRGVYGVANAASGTTYGVWGESDSTAGRGVYGWASATSGYAYGVLGQSASTDGRGVHGWAGATSGVTYGVYGQSNSTAGTGVAGVSAATSGYTYGVYGQSNSTDGRGVYGTAPTYGVYGHAVATSGTTYGVKGESASTDGRGVYGLASATSGTTYGVYGQSASTDGRGVYGLASASSGYAYGVQGESESPDGAGVYGLANVGGGGLGVWGSAPATTGGGVGVLGDTNSPYGHGVAGWAYSSSGGHGVYATSRAPAEGGAALYALNTHSGGIAMWGQNNSTDSTLVLVNQGSGDLLRAFISAGQLRFRFQNDGWARADGGWTTPAADFAEMLPAVPGLEPGDVLVVGADGKLARSTQAYQPTVVGVYSTRPGFVGGQPVEGELEGHIPLAVVGVVPVKASAENGPIRPGDLLVASATPGHAMKAGPNPPQGTVIGKALEGLEKGTGVIQMLVVLQ